MQLQDFLRDLNARMAAAKTTGFWSEEDKKRWINKSIVRACNFAPWNFLSFHSTQLTEKDREGYFFPYDYKPGGMILLKVDGSTYRKRTLAYYQDNDEDGIYAGVGDEYLLKPTPTEDGKIIDLYYRRRPVPLVDVTDEPTTPEEMDEPIVKLALGICLKKEPNRARDANTEITEAIAMLQALKDREDEEAGEMGYAGKATSSRWSK